MVEKTKFSALSGLTKVIDRILDFVEKKGNRLPHPITLFVILTAFVVVCSAILEGFGASVIIKQIDSATNVTKDIKVEATSLLSSSGIRYMFESAITNFTGFAPVGVVLVAMFGIAAADGTGLIKVSIKRLLINAPESITTAMVVFCGVFSNIASDAGYVVVIPLGALIFLSTGRHPLAGVAAAFFGVSGGFSANILIGSIDPLLGSFSTIGARVLYTDYFVSPLANYYFLFASTFLITIIGSIVTVKIIEPRLGSYNGVHEASFEALTEHENRGLKYALLALLMTVGAVLLMIIPEGAVLRDQETGSILGESPFMNSIVVIIALIFFFPGVMYGIGAKTIRSDKDLVQIISDIMGTMGGYLVLTFVAAQFVAYFGHSKIGLILAVKGSELLKMTHASGVVLLVIFILLSAFINLFIGSAVTKWSVMAPVFIPMFMMVGLSPEATQLAYRIGDSSTNIISPLMPFFAVVLAIAEKYDDKMGIGTLISLMLPYSVILLSVWIIFFIIWITLGLPIGPGVSIFI